MAQKKKRIIKVVDIVNAPKKGKAAKKNLYHEEDNVPLMEEGEIEMQIPQIEKTDEDRIIDKAFDFEEPKEEKKRISKKKKILGVGTFLVVVALVIYAATTLLPKVDVSIVAKKISWEFSDPITVRTDINKAEEAIRIIPGEIISQTKNGVFSFPASGEEEVERKAKGTITIYNAYSSAPQTLVATTRFETPDGKIFRLVEKTTVPGAKITEGKIDPSSIDAQVVADKAGPDYNIGPVEKFTIPGFAGSDKYGGFYGSSKNAMSGGFVGVAAYPTEEDVEKALAQAKEDISQALKADIASQIPQDLVIVPGSQKIEVTKENVDKNTNEKNEFTIAIEGTASTFVFQEKDLLEMLQKMALKDAEVSSDDYETKNYNISYQQPTINWENKTMLLPVQYNNTLAHKIDAETIQQQIAGKSEVDVKTYVLSLPGVDKLTVSFWPFWVKNVPQKTSRIHVTVE